jgi:hypothetical protein
MKSALILLLAPIVAMAAPAEISERQAADSINTLIKAKGKKYFGSCADQGRLSSGKTAAVIQADFGQVTPENSMKVGRNPTGNVEQRFFVFVTGINSGVLFSGMPLSPARASSTLPRQTILSTSPPRTTR